MLIHSLSLSPFLYAYPYTLPSASATHHTHDDRNTIDRTALNRVKPVSNKVTVPPGYDSPRSNAALALHFDSDVYVDPADEIYAIPPDDGDDELYAIPPELSDEEDHSQPSKLPPQSTPFQGNRMNGHAHPMTETNGVKGFKKLSPPRKSVEPAVSSNGSRVVKTSINDATGSTPPTSGDSKVSDSPRDSGDSSAAKSKPSIYDDTVFDNDNSKQAASDSFADDGAVYENTDFDQDSTVKSTLAKRGTISSTKSVQSPTRHKPKRHTPDDYEDLEDFEGKSPTDLIPALDDYVDMDGCEINMYVASEDLKHRGSDYSDTPTLSPRNPLSPGSTIPVPPGKWFAAVTVCDCLYEKLPYGINAQFAQYVFLVPQVKCCQSPPCIISYHIHVKESFF